MILTTKKGDITIRLLQNDNNEKYLLQEIFDLRVYCRNDFGLITHEKFPDGWRDEIDDNFNSDYFIAIHNDSIVGSGRVTVLTDIKNHPYYPAIQHNLPNDLIEKPIGYISRDDVLPEYRGNGIQKNIFNERYKLCKQKNIADVLIDIPVTGYQLAYYVKEGYTNLGTMDTGKLSWEWELGPAFTMHRKLI